MQGSAPPKGVSAGNEEQVKYTTSPNDGTLVYNM